MSAASAEGIHCAPETGSRETAETEDGGIVEGCAIPFDFYAVSMREVLVRADILGSSLRSVGALSYTTAFSWSAIFEG